MSAATDKHSIAPAMGVFVTGTDTGVGKTRVSSALLRLLARHGLCAAGMKPVASGAWLENGQWRNEDVDALRAAANVALPPELLNPYLLRSATAPHIAAAEEGRHIDLQHLAYSYRRIAAMAQAVVVEGAGGFMVPLDARHNTDDLAAALGLPVVLVVGIRLGCISHALLTARAIAARGLPLAGWVANHLAPDEPYAGAMVASLAQRIDAPLLAELPWRPDAGDEQVADLFDPAVLLPQMVPGMALS